MGAVEKLFVLVRQDLDHGPQLAQAIHGCDEFKETHPEVASEWRKRSNTVVALHVRDVGHLREIQEKARLRNIPAAVFCEPDLDNEPTCLVLGPTGRRLTSNLPLVS